MLRQFGILQSMWPKTNQAYPSVATNTADLCSEQHKIIKKKPSGV